MQISNLQLFHLKESCKSNWTTDLADEILSRHPKHIQFLGLTEGDLSSLIESLLYRFSSLGMTQRSQVFQLCLMALAVGGWFDRDPRFPSLEKLMRGEMPESRRLAYFHIEVRKLVDKIWGPYGAESRIQQMINSMEYDSRNAFPDLTSAGWVCDKINVSGFTAAGADRASVLAPLTPVIGTMAMTDPVHGELRRIVMQSSSRQDARLGIIAELRRRQEVLAQ